MEARFLLIPSARHLGMPQVPVPLSQEITRPGLEARPQWSYSFWRYKNGYSFQIESNDRLRGWSHPSRPGKPVSPWGWLTGAWRNTNSWKAASWLKCPSQNGRYIIGFCWARRQLHRWAVSSPPSYLLRASRTGVAESWKFHELSDLELFISWAGQPLLAYLVFPFQHLELVWDHLFFF